MGKSVIVESSPELGGIEEITQEEIDKFGVSFVFKRALRLLDVHAEQRKLQHEKYCSHVKQMENDIAMLELRLTQKDKDIDKLKEKCKSEQKQMVALLTEKDLCEMKLQAELKVSRHLNRDVENIQWTKNEIMSLVNRCDNIDKLRQSLMKRKLY